ncbi:FliI/YscN family ATPase [Porticoccaceae bacterium]|jgi:flagellum-specific ATP synthase|nr:FliI/YscN family ATPase [Porticoccaceae bacterium]MDA8978702.1 FliI/YscN family ATPase [bacterium]MBT6319192.1 FliI/YscN family ATPase [Porticoccaceae bacterium]MBT7258796.1 FliI/YscN family ATPase [Porticoccaceae bacterium]MBT7905577.1 FliI/YscN family ATPase [Porticoccaceae bacterium]
MTDFATQVDNHIAHLRAPELSASGKLVRVVGLTLEAKGIIAPLGAHCQVENIDTGAFIDAEVVGFHNELLYLMPFTEPSGIGPGARIWVRSNHSKASLGNAMLGRVVDGLGQPLDDKGPIAYTDQLGLEGLPINPMERGPIKQVLDTGIKAINSCLTLGQGQRIGLMAGSGVGKSVLLGMLTRNTKADVVVIGLIGERGREVQEFIQQTLGEEGLAKSVVVAAPANVSPVLRLKATNLSHLIAEYFRDQGKNVLLLCDSLTRAAHAQREIGLAIGEPPTAKGYPPSVFALLPRLIERAGVGRKGVGSITAIYTVLAEGDDRADPIVDIARASLDGQVMLSRELADAAHYPAIDLSGSISRVMNSLLSPEQLKSANLFRRLWTLYQQNQDLIQVGAYETGANQDLDKAIRLRPQMESLLQQSSDESVSIDNCHAMMQQLTAVQS